MKYEIKPIEGESYEGRQWGYVLEGDGIPLMHLTTGGTGDCWNLRSIDGVTEDDNESWHICDLGEFIEALQFLRDSEAHKEHVARWAV